MVPLVFYARLTRTGVSRNGTDNRAGLAGVSPTGPGVNPDLNQQTNELGAQVGKKEPAKSNTRYATTIHLCGYVSGTPCGVACIQL
jgi:hypothetical protein